MSIKKLFFYNFLKLDPISTSLSFKMPNNFLENFSALLKNGVKMEETMDDHRVK